LTLICSTGLILVTIVTVINLQQTFFPQETTINQTSASEEDDESLNQRCVSPLNTTKFIRIVCSIVAAVFIVAENCLSLALIDCSDEPIEEKTNSTINIITKYDECLLLLRHYFLISPVVVLICISFFFHLGFIIKTTLMFIYLIAVILIKTFCIDNKPEYSDQNSFDLYLFCIIIILCFYYRDRYMERTSRSHFLWKAKLRVEQDDVETIGGINKILLENILPQHVAQHFLLNCCRSDALYHERFVSNIISSFLNSFQTLPLFMKFFKLLLMLSGILPLLLCSLQYQIILNFMTRMM